MIVRAIPRDRAGTHVIGPPGDGGEEARRDATGTGLRGEGDDMFSPDNFSMVFSTERAR
jgi:hypothetical protein